MKKDVYTKIGLLVVAIILPIASIFVMRGALAPSSGLDTEQQAVTSQLDEIVKRSGGRWENLTPADKDFLINKMSYGNEQSARMLLEASAGKLKGAPGGGGP